jgi:hypothetical protein
VTKKISPLILNESWFRLSLVKEIMNMKKLNLAFAILVTAVMAGNAATSPVVGYQVQNFSAGNTVHTVTFVKPDLFQGVASSKTGTSLVVSGATFGNYGLVDGSPTHYAKILDGPLVGYVFDIISSTSTSIVVDGDLSTAGSTPRFLVRPHVRLADVFATSTGLTDVNDTFTLFNSDGTSTVGLRLGTDSPTGWISPSTEQPINPIIYPGQGFLLTTASSGTFTYANHVDTTQTAVPLFPGTVNLVSRASPASNSLQLVDSGMSLNMTPVSDTVEFWTNDGSLGTVDVALSLGADGFVNPATEAPTTTSLLANAVVNVTVSAPTVWLAPAPYTPPAQ